MVTIWLGLGLLACNYAISYSHLYFVLCPFKNDLQPPWKNDIFLFLICKLHSRKVSAILMNGHHYAKVCKNQLN